ncbi:WD40-repeat-containing domain protein [Kockovaella imperatae]|uniref:WD40-repeat-containing domain protein n=1 Tax=Kockovaella imperatae TaxID=4999 RepID=A0A1Y1UR66_9TREE|nr:WD40-repeat-containing domain protein [Kockovaella imperatae]ORX39635.1 WD40-repeat-containing domain protein [Kockovaella imperatae]
MDIRPLPYIDIQHDALSVFDDVEQGVVGSEDIWVSGYKAGSSSVHGRARVVPREGGGTEIRARDGVEIKRLSKTHFEVSIPALHLDRIPVKFPRAVIHPPYTKASKLSPPLQVNSIALSPNGSHLLVGGPDGYCGVIPVGPGANAQDMIQFKGHVGDVLDVHWFPSGEVCLTTGSDLSIRIWGSKDGINPRTLTGHSRAVTSLYIVGVGKQILSGSKDGTVRLWEVGASTQLKRWNLDHIRPVEAVLVIEDDHGKAVLGAQEEERLVLVLTQVGMEIWNWSTPSSGSPRQSLEWQLGSNLVCGAYCPSLGILVTGHTNGVIAVRRLETLDKPTLFRRNESPVYSLAFKDTALYAGTAAGLPCRLEVSLKEGDQISLEVKEEFAGWEAVGVESWTIGQDSMWCAGGEGGIRRY